MHEKNLQFGNLRSLLEAEPTPNSYLRVGDLLNEVRVQSGLEFALDFLPYVIDKIITWPTSITLQLDEWYDINKTTVLIVYLIFNSNDKNSVVDHQSTLSFLKTVTFGLIGKIEPIIGFSSSYMDSLPVEALWDEDRCKEYFTKTLEGTENHKFLYLYDNHFLVFKSYLSATFGQFLGLQRTKSHHFPWKYGEEPEYFQNFFLIKQHNEERHNRALNNEDQMSSIELELAEKHLQIKIPRSIKDFYLSFGRLSHRWSDVFYPPWNLFHDIDPDVGIIRFCTENQGLVEWIVLAEDTADDPQVYTLSNKRIIIQDVPHIQIPRYWNSIEDTGQTFSEFMADGLGINSH